MSRAGTTPRIDYAESLKAHLARYKRERLGVREDGVHLATGKSYEHILPQHLHRLNILESARREFWRFAEGPDAERRGPIRLHRDFHHLNSSQALAFNVFFPFFWRLADATPVSLLQALGISAPGDVRRASFETTPDPAEGTCFDFVVDFKGGARLLVEVKLSESAFGRCKKNDLYRGRLRDIYRARLRGKVSDGALAESSFFERYQLFRNLSHLRPQEGDVLLLLLPRANAGTWQEAEDFLEDCIAPDTRAAVRLVAIEDLCLGLERSWAREPVSPSLQAQMRMFSEKYLPDPHWASRTSLPVHR